MATITTTNISTSFENSVSDKATGFGVRKYGVYLACANGDTGGVADSQGGVTILDATTITAPSEIFQQRAQTSAGTGTHSADVRDVIIHGTPKTAGAVAIVCWRDGSYSAATGVGMIYLIDISDSTPSNWDVFPQVDVGNGDWAGTHYYDTTIETGRTSAAMYSAMSSDGTHVYVACQRTGVRKFLISDIGAGPTASNTTEAVVNWETQGLYVFGDYVYGCSTSYGLRVLNKADLTDLTSEAGVFTTSDIGVDPDTGLGLKPWDCKPHPVGSHMIFSLSSNASTEKKNPCGILMLDISTPSAPVLGNKLIVPVSDRDTWNDVRDPASKRLTVINNLAIVSNLKVGCAYYDITDPVNPIYSGMIGSSLIQASGASYKDSIASVVAWKDGPDFYIGYKDGYGDGSNSFYIDQLLFNGSTHMSFTGGSVPDAAWAGGSWGWSLTTNTKVRTAETKLSNDGLGTVGLVSVIETTEPMTLTEIKMHGAYNGAGGGGTLLVWLVRAQTVTNAARYTPGIIGATTADAAALTDKYEIVFPGGSSTEQTFTVAVNETIPAGKMLLVAQPKVGAVGTFNISNLYTDVGSTGTTTSADDADTDDTWSLAARSLAIWGILENISGIAINTTINTSINTDINTSIQ